MKRIVLFAAFAVLSLSAFAQQKSVVGKWTLVKLSAQGSTFDFEDPAQVKKELTKQMEASGQPADSAMVEIVFQSFFNSLATLTFNFGSDGKLVMGNQAGDDSKKEEETYTVDYPKGEIVSKGKEKEQKINFKFEGEKLVLTLEEQPGKLSVLTLKRVK